LSWVLCTTTSTFLSWCTQPFFSNFELKFLSWGWQRVPSSLGSRTVGVMRVQLIMRQLKTSEIFLSVFGATTLFPWCKSLARHFKTQIHSDGPHSQNCSYSRSLVSPTLIKALHGFFLCIFSSLTCLPGLSTDLKSRKGLYSGPSPIQEASYTLHGKHQPISMCGWQKPKSHLFLFV
jgi:hypothetical protein